MTQKKKSRLTVTGAAFLAATMLFSNPAFSDHHGFPDVDEDNVHYEAILEMKAKGIFEGNTDGTFGTGDSIERQHVAATIARMHDLDVPEDYNLFLERYGDVDENSAMAEDIAAVTAAGFFKGGTSGNFYPRESLTRQEAASVLVRSFGLKQVYIKEHININLDDVHPVHKEDVQILRDLSLTFQTDNYFPRRAVTRDEFASFLFRTHEFDREDFQGEEYFNLSVLHNNDLHSRVEAYPHMITTYNEARTTRPDALTLDAGDVFSGTLYFNLFEGQDSVEFMNMIGYDAFVFGNHEFDLGDDDGHPALAAFVEAADFPFLASNMDFSEHEEFADMITDKDGITYQAESGMIYDGIVKEVNGEDVGIFGINTEDTLDISSPMDVAFSDFAETSAHMVELFEDEGVNKIIALTHLGYDSDPSVGNDLRLAAEVEGIDIIVGGHSHTVLEEPTVVTENADGEVMDPTVIVQAGEYGNLVGALDVVFNEEGVIVQANSELLATGDRVADPEAIEILEPYTEQVEEFGLESAGFELEEQLPNPRLGSDSDVSVRANETALGNLISDGFLRAGQRANPDTLIAFQNGGGIRAPLPETVDGDGPYDITIGDLITVQPFGNRLSLLELSGEEVMMALEHSVRNAPAEDGGFLHVAGMKFTYDSSLAAGSRVQSVEVYEEGDWVELDNSRMYVVAMNNFTANGGDGFQVFEDAKADGRETIVGDTDYQILTDHAQKLAEEEDEVAPVIEGRITDVSED